MTEKDPKGAGVTPLDTGAEKPTDDDYRKALMEVLQNPFIAGFMVHPTRLRMLCEPITAGAFDRHFTILLDPHMPEDQIGVLAAGTEGFAPETVNLPQA